MAYVVRHAISTDGASAATTHTVTLPTHETNDLLVVLVTIDRLGSADGGNFTVTTATGWTNAARDAVAGQTRFEIWYKPAASSSETNPVFNTPSSADTWCSTCLVIRDADTTTPIDAVSSVLKTTSTDFAGPTVTTTSANCLVLSCASLWSSNWPLTGGGLIYGTAAQNTNVNNAYAWTVVEDSAGTSLASRWTQWVGYTAICFAIAIKNKSGGHVPGYVDPGTTIGTMITPLAYDIGWSWQSNAAGVVSMPGSLSLSTIGAKTTVTYQAATTASESGRLPKAKAHRQSVGSAAVATTTTRGHQYTFGSAVNMSSGMLMINTIGGSPSEMAVGLDKVGSGGVLVTVADSSNNYRAFEVGARNSNPSMLGWNVAVIDCNQSVTDFGESGTPPSVSAINKVLFTVTPQGGSIFTGINLSEIWMVNTIHCSGGDSTTPFNFDDLIVCGNSFRAPMIEKTGAAAALSYMPIQFGGGDSIKMEIENAALQFAEAWDTSTFAVNFHADPSAEKLGVTYYGVSGDSIKHKNSLITSATPFYVTIHASSTSAATWDFSGLTIAGAGTVTLRPVTTFSSMVFADCATINTTGASGVTLSSCTISNTTNRPDFSDDTLTGVNITSAAGSTCCKIDLGTTLTNVNLIAGDSSSYGLEIAEAGTYALDTCTWTNFAAGKKVNITAGSGTFTLNASGKLNTAAVNASGVTLIFDVVTTTIQHTGLTTGTRYQLTNMTQLEAELANSTAGVSGFTYSTATAVAEGDQIRLRTTYQSGTTVKWGEWFGIVTLGGTLDFSANTPTTKSEFVTWGIDGSTVTECSSDYLNIEVEISTGASTLSRLKVIAFIAYAMTTADGIRNWFGILDIKDSSNVVIDVTVADLVWKNTGTVACVLTERGVWIRKSDSSALLEEGSASLTMEVDPVRAWSTGSGLTGSESAHLLSIPTNPTTFAGGDIDGYSLEQALKIIAAVAAGDSVKTDDTWAFKAVDGSKTRVTVPIDTDTAERTGVTIDATG